MQGSHRASGADSKLGHMDVDGTVSQTDSPKNEVEDERFLPFGAGLLPTATGRGNLLHSISIIELEKALEKTLYEGQGVLGMVRSHFCFLVLHHTFICTHNDSHLF
jgi:hypothetical protein